MATFLANEINATDREVTGPTEQVQIMFPLKDKNTNHFSFLFHFFIHNFKIHSIFLCSQIALLVEASRGHLNRN